MTHPMSKVVEAPFAVGDTVETIKGARFWGEVVSVYTIQREYQVFGKSPQLLEGPTEWRVDVRAVHPDFLGTIHVYPAQQLRGRPETIVSAEALAEIQTPSDAEPVAWEGYWPGVGSINSHTAFTRVKSVADAWKAGGAEVKPLIYADASPYSAAIEDAARALEPFADYATIIEGHYATVPHDEFRPSQTLPLFDFRRAREALAAIRALTPRTT